jgi:hypothetical protein
VKKNTALISENIKKKNKIINIFNLSSKFNNTINPLSKKTGL